MNRTNSVLCSRCKDYLKSPVYTSKNTIEVICGSCKWPNEYLQKLTTYENITRSLHYACHNEIFGCKESYLLNELEKHEKECEHKQYKCEFCAWSGTYEQLITHYKTKTIQDEKNFTIKKQDDVGKYMFCIGNEIFMLRVKTGNKFMYCVQHIDWDKKDFLCTISFSFTKIEAEVESYRFGLCDYKDTYMYMRDQIICNMKITERLESDRDPIFSRLCCPICLEVLLPPIYQCFAGHSYCNICCWKLKCCGICRRQMSMVRNTTIESLIERLDLQRICKYNACGYKCNILYIERHEKKCKFQPTECPIDTCKWNDRLSKLKCHLDEKHNDIVVQNSLKIDFRSKNKNYFLFAHNNNLKLTYEFRKNELFMELTTVGVEDINYKAIFELKVGTGEKKIVFSLSNEKTCIEIPLRNINPYNGDKKFDCHINIDRKVEISAQTLTTLVCHKCKNRLDSFPVYSDSKEGTSFCAQCTPKTDNIVLECAYISQAQNLVFPCKHKNCMIKNTLNRLKQHEENCKYKLFACKLCDWQGTLVEIGPHASQVHNIQHPRHVNQNKILRSLTEYSLEALEVLRCEICSEYMVIPIYQCSCSKNYCALCAKKEDFCKLCMATINQSRNYSLEEITALVQYPCKHECGNRFDATKIKIHEKVCNNARFDCPASSCSFQVTINNLISHIIREHPKLFLEGTKHQFELSKSSVENFVFLERDTEVFKLIFAKVGECICFLVQYMGNPEDCEKFYYTIQIPYCNDNEDKIVVEQKCSPWMEECLNVFVNNAHITELPLKLFDSYLNKKTSSEKCLQFYINVFVKDNKKS